MFYLLIGILGLILGSFASVIIHRLHTQQRGIFGGRSKCTHCQNQLSFLDLIPVASYLWNLAKCRFCKAPIAMRYPLLEVSMAGIFILTTYLVGQESLIQLIFFLFLSFVFIILSFYDFLFKEVPDQISLPALGVCLIYTLFFQTLPLKSLLLGLAVPVLFFGLLYFGSKGKWLGGGDIRVGALMGAVLGWPLILVGLFVGYLTGALYSLAGLSMGKFNKKTQIPFVPFLLLGTYVALFWGEDLLSWYSRFLI